MKRNYYYCEANSMVYTEREMKRSYYPQTKFVLIGEYYARKQAEQIIIDSNIKLVPNKKEY